MGLEKGVAAETSEHVVRIGIGMTMKMFLILILMQGDPGYRKIGKTCVNNEKKKEG